MYKKGIEILINKDIPTLKAINSVEELKLATK
jgi:hypothetical protein